MASAPAWRPLPLPRSPGVPVLLVSFHVGTADYTIRITDMANMWVETLDRKAICMRGWAVNTTIDPSDTPENMAKFLNSLTSALDSSQKGHDQTSIGISTASVSDAGEDGLTVSLTCELPGLQPLKWPMHLKKSPLSAVATDLVLPLIQAHRARDKEVDSLIQSLKEKDAALTKVLDKLEATGTNLEHVFTNLAGRKKVTRLVAEEKVKGLAPFNKRKWKADLEDSDEGPDNANDLVQGVFGREGLQYQALMETDPSSELDSWWREFKGTSQSHQRHHKPTPPEKRTPSPSVHPPNTDDDDFQIQSTPPHLMSARDRAAPRNALPPEDASTEDDETSSILDARTPAVVPETQGLPGRTKTVSRLGTIGRKAQSAVRSPTPKTSPIAEKTSAPAGDDSETASEGEDDEATASLPDDSPPRPPSPKPAPAKKGGIGRIGGPKPRPEASEKTEMSEAGQTTTAETGGAAARPKKLGVIGKKIGGATSSDGPVDSAGRGRSAIRDDPHGKEQPRETSLERADRRREELKRDLEKKAAAGPAKKKRKF